MGIVVDIVIVAIILLSVFLGYRKGLIALAIKLCAFIIAIVIAFILYKPVSNFVINTTNIDETIENSILEKVNDVIKEDKDKELESELIESAKTGMLPETAKTISDNIVSGGVMILLFIIARIGLIFVTSLANVVAKVPVIKQINKTGGIIYGFLRGAILIYVVLLLISVIGQINPKNSVYLDVNESYIGKIMYENNVLDILFKN